MSTSNFLDRLQKIVPIILDDSLDYLELQNALKDFKSLCLEASDIDLEAEDSKTSIFLKSGKAIGPAWAGACIDDIVRTKRFVRGLKKAVDDVRQEKGDKPVKILYSGTGPFATLVLPLITVYAPEEVQFALLEINPISFKNVQTVFHAFEAEGFVSRYINEDASTYALPQPGEFDIVVVECLQHALAREPQVAITHNLISQCREDVILVPETISLHVSLINTTKEIEALTQNEAMEISDYRENSRSVFNLNKDSMRSIPAPLDTNFCFPKEVVSFPKAVVAKMNTVAITTEIRTYGEEYLTYKESGLTIPKTVRRLNGSGISMQVETCYRLGKDPELEMSFINE